MKKVLNKGQETYSSFFASVNAMEFQTTDAYFPNMDLIDAMYNMNTNVRWVPVTTADTTTTSVTVSEELPKYNFDILGVQEDRWD
jgi:hypothetical protein